MPNNEGRFISCADMLIELLKIMAWELNASTDRELALQAAARKSITVFIEHIMDVERKHAKGESNDRS